MHNVTIFSKFNCGEKCRDWVKIGISVPCNTLESRPFQYWTVSSRYLWSILSPVIKKRRRKKTISGPYGQDIPVGNPTLGDFSFMTSANHRVMVRKDMVSRVSSIIKISINYRIIFYMLALYFIKYRLYIFHRVTELFHKQNDPQIVQAFSEVHSSGFLKGTAFYYDCNVFFL